MRPRTITFGFHCSRIIKKSRNNLTEAKQSAKREFIRMAAGQILDYAFVGRKQLGMKLRETIGASGFRKGQSGGIS